MQFYLLRREFGISMVEAEHELPAQEIELLLRQHVRVRKIENGDEEGAADGGEPLSGPPKEFT